MVYHTRVNPLNNPQIKDYHILNDLVTQDERTYRIYDYFLSE